MASHTRRRRLRLQSTTAVLVGALLGTALQPPAARAVEVHGDDAEDRFVGTGGVVLPPGGDREQRHAAAHCPGCRWRMVDPCAHATNPGAEAACRTVTAECGEGGSLLRTFISRDGGASWEYVGMHCIPETGPVTTAEVGEQLHDDFERRVPSGSIRIQPSQGVLAHLPVVFDSGQPQHLAPSEHVVAGLRVRLTPRATWTWAFGDGATLTTERAGSRYPALDVSHTYRRVGRHEIRLRTVWRAEYTVEGLGPIPVPEPVVQEASAEVWVGQGRAVLVP